MDPAGWISAIVGSVALVFLLKDRKKAKAKDRKEISALITKLDNLRISVQESLDEAERFWLMSTDGIPNAVVATAIGQRVHDFEANKLDDKDFNELCALDEAGKPKFSDIPKLVKWFFDVSRMGTMTIYRSRPDAY
jgi:hypothetical protein